MTLDEASDGGSDASSVQKLTESLSAIVETSTLPKSKGKREGSKRGNGTNELRWEINGWVRRKDRMRWETVSHGHKRTRQESSRKKGKGKAKGKGNGQSGEKSKGRVKSLTCYGAEELDTPQGCAPVTLEDTNEDVRLLDRGG